MAEDKNNPETLPLEQEDKKKLLSQRSQPAYDDNDEEDFDSDDKKYGEKYVKKLRNVCFLAPFRPLPLLFLR